MDAGTWDARSVGIGAFARSYGPSADEWATRRVATRAFDQDKPMREALPPRILSWAAEQHAARIKAGRK